jgi:nucleotide-binding universal stress UspA family protein
MEGGAAVDVAGYREAARQWAERQLDEFALTHLADVTANKLLEEGDPARCITAHAHDHEFGLIVLPTHGYGPFRRFVVGSLTAKILHDADCPVWTGVHLEGSPSEPDLHVSRVLAAVDLGPRSESVLEWAKEFAQQWAARLSIVHATPSLEGHTGEYFDPSWQQSIRDRANKRIELLQMKAKTDAPAYVSEGDPAHVIRIAVEHQKVDVVVVGRGPTTGTFGRLRAHAYSIVRQSPCPVVSV